MSNITPLPFDILQYNPRDLFVTGSYCPEGTDGPLSCPPGTYGATTGLRNISECTPCTAGSYCTTPGLTTPEGQGNSIIIIYVLYVWQLKTSLFKIDIQFCLSCACFVIGHSVSVGLLFDIVCQFLVCYLTLLRLKSFRRSEVFPQVCGLTLYICRSFVWDFYVFWSVI